MTDQEEEPPSITALPVQNGNAASIKVKSSEPGSLFARIKDMFGTRQDTTLRETIEEYIEDDSTTIAEESISAHEKTLISNVLDLRDMTAEDIMVPRADIVAIPHDITQEELFALLAERQYSRLPVYKDGLDNIIGTLHVKDLIAAIARGESISVETLSRKIPIVSPAMQTLDLLMQMRITKKHMVLVVDEYGGIDGLITVGDVIESIVGELEDEHDKEHQPEITIENDGTIIADARFDLSEFEEIFGSLLDDEEREESETLGGLVFDIAGRVPARGEVISHGSGMKFEILEADPRRVKKLLIRNIPPQN